MGLIKVETAGSFGSETRIFRAMEHGHVDAVAQAIEYLSGEVLPKANVNDHKCHEQGVTPEGGWDRQLKGGAV